MADTAVAEKPAQTDQVPTPEPDPTPAPAPTATTTAPQSAAAKKAAISDQLGALAKEQTKLTQTIRILSRPLGPDDDAEVSAGAVKEFTADLDRLNKRIETLKVQLANVDRDEQIKVVAAPFLAKLGKIKIKDAFLLPTTVQIVDLEKMENDTKNAAQKALAFLSLIGALKQAGQGIDPGVMANLPTLAIARDGDNNVTFSFASKPVRVKGDPRSSGAPRASSNARRVTSCELRPELVGMVVGKAEGAKYPSWQAVYLDLADPETRARMDAQSRNKRDWFETAFKATTEEIDEDGNVIEQESAA